MELWDRIQQVQVGASRQVCQRCSSDEHPYQYDSRPYGTALADLFPGIGQWTQGHWSEETIAECLALFRYAISHRSRPMLAVGVEAVKAYPTVKARIWAALTEQEKVILKQSLAIGVALE
jgi:hypothetical protein